MNKSIKELKRMKLCIYISVQDLGTKIIPYKLKN